MTDNNPEPLLVSLKDALRVRGCSRSHAYRKIASGEWDAVKDGSALRITYASLKRDAESLPKAQINITI